jgi:hypothetical protein
MGGKVEKYAGGWSVGPTEYDFGDQSYAQRLAPGRVVQKPETARSCLNRLLPECGAALRRPDVRPAHPRIPQGSWKG